MVTIQKNDSSPPGFSTAAMPAKTSDKTQSKLAGTQTRFPKMLSVNAAAPKITAETSENAA